MLLLPACAKSSLAAAVTAREDDEPGGLLLHGIINLCDDVYPYILIHEIHMCCAVDMKGKVAIRRWRIRFKPCHSQMHQNKKADEANQVLVLPGTVWSFSQINIDRHAARDLTDSTMIRLFSLLVGVELGGNRWRTALERSCLSMSAIVFGWL